MNIVLLWFGNNFGFKNLKAYFMVWSYSFTGCMNQKSRREIVLLRAIIDLFGNLTCLLHCFFWTWCHLHGLFGPARWLQYWKIVLGRHFLFFSFMRFFTLCGRERGFQNLYTLKGGVSHYLENEGPAEWVGNLFVFDDRLSLPPFAYKPESTAVVSWNQQGPKNNSFANCYICGSQVCELRHRNCANIECNLLFL